MYPLRVAAGTQNLMTTPFDIPDFSYSGSIHACEYAKSRLARAADEGEAKGHSHTYDRYVVTLLDALLVYLKTEFEERLGYDYDTAADAAAKAVSNVVVSAQEVAK
jgi:hypothetical protein